MSRNRLKSVIVIMSSLLLTLHLTILSQRFSIGELLSSLLLAAFIGVVLLRDPSKESGDSWRD